MHFAIVAMQLPVVRSVLHKFTVYLSMRKKLFADSFIMVSYQIDAHDLFPQ